MHSRHWFGICSLLLIIGSPFPVSAVALGSVSDPYSDHQGHQVVNSDRRNNLEVGSCQHPDQRIYTDNTIVENGGPSTLNGTLEIYIDAPIKITCIRIEDQVTDGTGAVPWIHSGGIGEAWVFVGVQAKYGKGFNFNIHLFGVPDSEKLKSVSLTSFRDNRV